jgi:hypothetical protein
MSRQVVNTLPSSFALLTITNLLRHDTRLAMSDTLHFQTRAILLTGGLATS